MVGQATKTSLWKLYGVAWGSGRGPERFLIGLTVCTLFLVVVFAAILYWMVWDRFWPPDAIVSYALAVMSLSMYLPAIEDAFYGVQFRREALARGLLREQALYALELNRYVEASGRDGHLPGDLNQAALGWIAYYGMLGVSVWFTVAFYHTVGHFAPFLFVLVDALVAFGFFFAYARRTRRRLHLAEEQGFGLLRLRPKGMPTARLSPIPRPKPRRGD